MFCYPLLCTFLSAFIMGSPIGRYIGHRGSILLSITLLGIAMLSSIAIWYEVVYGGCEVQIDFFGTWFSLGSFDITWSSYTDIFAAHMLLTVLVVSFAVHCYAVVYMKSDPHLSLFMCYLSAFTFSMLILVSGSNMLVMLLGWEMIGVCSFLLISYWSHRLAATKSAHKAIVVNRISDGLLLWSIIWLWWYTGTLEYSLILLNDSNNISSFLSTAILLGCMGKSVQIIFHVWLADSMEGPTPVSALIHAATLVTAGKFFSSNSNHNDNSEESEYSDKLEYSENLNEFISYEDEINSKTPLKKDIKPLNCVEYFPNLTPQNKYLIKKKYFNIGVIYSLKNNLNGRMYVGHTKNMFKRAENYFSKSYLNKIKNTMPICGALLKYGHENFSFYALEIVKNTHFNYLRQRENHWAKIIHPSYNIADILDSFKVKQYSPDSDTVEFSSSDQHIIHTQKGKIVSDQVRKKTRVSVKAYFESLTQREREHLSCIQKRIPIYCYDYYTGKYLFMFEGKRIMARALAPEGPSISSITRKLDTHKPFKCNYNGCYYTLLLCSKPKPL